MQVPFSIDILILRGVIIVSVHGTLKLEIRNWKFGLHAFVLF